MLAPTLGTLYLIPVPLGAPDSSAAEACLPARALALTRTLDRFVVENAKTARAMIKAMAPERAIRELAMDELNEHTPPTQIAELLAPLLAGEDVGLMSEAGCPAVADPGALLVEAAHRAGVRVVPLVGPSSILLAVMGSGLSGQRFAFHGYLPAKGEERTRALRDLESDSRKAGRAQVFIETPYRNAALFDALLATCQSTTRVCIARNLTQPDEWLKTRTIGAWKKERPPELERRPTVFVLQAS